MLPSLFTTPLLRRTISITIFAYATVCQSKILSAILLVISGDISLVVGAQLLRLVERKALYRLSNSFPYLLNRVGVRMGELFSRRIASFGVTLPMYRVLAALWEKRISG